MDEQLEKMRAPQSANARIFFITLIIIYWFDTIAIIISLCNNNHYCENLQQAKRKINIFL
jgi:hypothetical protein